MSSGNRASSFGPILRIKASANDRPAEVPETMLTANDEKRLIKIWMVFPQLLLLNFSAQPQKWKEHHLLHLSQNQVKTSRLDKTSLICLNSVFPSPKTFSFLLALSFLGSS